MKFKLISTLMLGSVTGMMGKTPNPDVVGSVIDENGEPVAYVNVVLLNATDSSFVQGATTDAAGRFIIRCEEATGILRASSVGYNTHYYNIDKRQVGQEVSIQLQEDSQMLQEAVVNAQLPKTKLTGNSMVTGIEGTVLEKSGTAKEMLSKVPGMTTKDDELEVLGKGAPVFYINGRKVQDRDELKRLNSSEIKEVEVITNPGAQYDATVNAVVRIKTIRRQGTGFGYDLELGNNQDLAFGYSDPSGNLNLRYRHKDVDVFGTVNYWKWDVVNDTKLTQHSFLGKQQSLITIDQNSHLRNEWNHQGMNYTMGANWQISENHSVGIRIENGNQFKSGGKMNQESLVITSNQEKNAREEEYSKTRQREHDSDPYNWSGNAYYNGRIGKLGIDFNVDFLTNKNRSVTNIDNNQDALNAQMQTISPTTNRMWADKLVLSYPIWKGQLQAGTEMSFVTRKSDYLFQIMNSAQGYNSVSIPSTSSEVEENNIAAFVEYAAMVPGVGGFNAGLRYEHVGLEYTDCLDGKNSMSRYTDDFFPSFSWANQFGAWQTSLNYSIKTQRPNYWMLSSVVNFLNPYSLQTGDPTLKNASSQMIGANVRYKFVNLYAQYHRIDNALTQWSYIYNEDGVILIKNINLKEPIRSMGYYLTASPTFGCYSPNWTLAYMQYFNSMTSADPREANGERKITYDKPLYVANLNNAFRFKHSWQLEANVYMMSKGDYMNMKVTNNTCNLGFVVQKCWLKNDALCLRASANDVLQRSSQDIEMDCGYYKLNQSSRTNQHRLDVTLRYTFNATPSKYKGTGAGREAASRMNN